MRRRTLLLSLGTGLIATLGLGPAVAIAARSSSDATPRWTVQSNQGFAFMGNSVAGAGDVNGDGYPDVIVGAYQYDNGQTDEGRALAYYGSVGGPSHTADWTAEANQGSAYSGISVDGAGDVNGDGYDDVIVGATGYSNGETAEGRAFVYYGSAAGLASTPGWTAESNQNLADFGYSVGGAGDVNGDGYDDVIVGCPFCANGQADEGEAFVYEGSAAGLSAIPRWTGQSNQTNSGYGLATGRAGDVNGDGYDDVIVTAEGFDGSLADAGRAFLYEGSPAGLSTTPDWTADGDQSFAEFGQQVTGAVDVNADGYDDVLIGAPEFSNIRLAEGKGVAYYGSPSGLSSVPSWTVVGRQEYARFGGSMSGGGDMNGDGIEDAVVGSWGYTHGQIEEGRTFTFCGSPSGLSTTACRTAESDREQAFFGVSVGGAGDVNGDGYDDVIVGATGFTNPQYGEGGAMLINGAP